MIISKQKYIRVLERTIKSYPKGVRDKLFPYFWSVVIINEEHDFGVGFRTEQDRKKHVFFRDDIMSVATHGRNDFPNYLRKAYPTLPLWKRAIQDAVKKRLIRLMKL